MEVCGGGNEQSSMWGGSGPAAKECPDGGACRLARKRSHMDMEEVCADASAEEDDNSANAPAFRRQSTMETAEEAIRECSELRCFLATQFTLRMGLTESGGPNFFVINVEHVSPHAMLLLLDHAPGEAGLQSLAANGAEEFVTFHLCTNRVLDVPVLDHLKKRIENGHGFVQPSPNCVLKYSILTKKLLICGYSEFRS
jgi:hypothetical protein